MLFIDYPFSYGCNTITRQRGAYNGAPDAGAIAMEGDYVVQRARALSKKEPAQFFAQPR
jgi:hypothetical protein